MEEDKTHTKALSTGDKTKMEIQPAKIHSSIEFELKQFKSHFMWSDQD